MIRIPMANEKTARTSCVQSPRCQPLPRAVHDAQDRLRRERLEKMRRHATACDSFRVTSMMRSRYLTRRSLSVRSSARTASKSMRAQTVGGRSFSERARHDSEGFGSAFSPRSNKPNALESVLVNIRAGSSYQHPGLAQPIPFSCPPQSSLSGVGLSRLSGSSNQTNEIDQ
jgi:hypothetical protein